MEFLQYNNNNNTKWINRTLVTADNTGLSSRDKKIFNISGGVFTVSGILDKLVYNSGRILNKKTEIGKTG